MRGDAVGSVGESRPQLTPIDPSLIGEYGGAEDLLLLRSFIDQVDLSESVRKALSAIEKRAALPRH